MLTNHFSMSLHSVLASGLLVSVLGSHLAAASDTVISLDSRAAYLHTNLDASLNATPIELTSLGFVPGDIIRLEHLGGWDAGPGGDVPHTMTAAFSSSASLLDSSFTYRIPGAIDAGNDVVTGFTYFGNQPTDIPEDFLVADGTSVTQVCIEIPAGATHLFVAGVDSLYQDNTDPNGDFAVRITLLTCPEDCAGPPNGVVDVADLLALLAAWGDTGSNCDVDCDGNVNVSDLLAVLGAWGACP